MKETANSEKEMSFFAHIGELRSHLIRSFLAMIVSAILVAVFWKKILDNFIMAPLKSDFLTYRGLNHFVGLFGMDNIYDSNFDLTKYIRNLIPSGQITSQIYAILICSLIISIPYIVWEIWKFIKPGLKENEKKYATGAVLAITFFFLLGILFSYFLLIPFSVQFLFTYNPFGIENEWTLVSYINLFVQTLLAMGIVFLLPVFVYFLTSIGILTPTFMKTYRRHAFLVVLIVAAIITPADLLSMIIAAFPLWILYEFSILVSNYVYKKKQPAKGSELMNS